MSDTNKNERDNDDDDDYREWSSLPDDIWSMLREHLASFPLDVLRFRSVCSFFRSLFPPPSSASFPSSPLVLPRFSFPIPPFPSPIDAFVSPTTLYRLDRPFQNDNEGWLIKVQHPLPQEDGGRGKFRLLDPLSCRRINDLTSNGGSGDGGGFYLNDFRLTELSTSYALRFIRDSSSIPGISKLIIYSNSSFSSVFLINDNGKLGFAKNGDDDITVINNKILDFNDIILHQNQPYVVDRWGTLSRIDESRNTIDYSQPLFGHLGHLKHLITSEHLFIVDRFLDESNDAKYPLESGLNFNTMHQQWRHGHSRLKTASFNVYKLDEECGKWVEVRCLGEKAFVLSHDCCFAVRAKEFVGFRENCIYFTEQFETFVFSLEEGNIENLPCTPGYSQLF